jgi:hypothetical protein
MDTETKTKVFCALCDGELHRGTGGVLFVKDESFSYIFPNEFTNEDFASKMQEVVDENQKDFFIVVLEKDRHLHTFMYPKMQVLQEANSGHNAIKE